MNIFLQHLNSPEYMHVLLNPLPVYGLTFGTLALVLALFLRNHRVTVAALVLVFVGAISAWPVYQYGESAYDRVKSMSDAPGEQWLDEHMARGEKNDLALLRFSGRSSNWSRCSFEMAAHIVPDHGRHTRIGWCHSGHWRLHRVRRRPRSTQRIPFRSTAASAHGRTPP